MISWIVLSGCDGNLPYARFGVLKAEYYDLISRLPLHTATADFKIRIFNGKTFLALQAILCAG